MQIINHKEIHPAVIGWNKSSLTLSLHSVASEMKGLIESGTAPNYNLDNIPLDREDPKPWCQSFCRFNSSTHKKYSITASRSFTFLFGKIKYGHTEPPVSRVSQSLSREVPFAQRGGLGISQKPNTTQSFQAVAAGRWPTPAWGLGTTPGAVSSHFPSGQGACHCSTTSALLQPMLEATEKMVLVLEPNSGFEQIDTSCCSLNTTLQVESIHSSTCFIILRAVLEALACSNRKPGNGAVFHHSALYNC